MSSRPRRPPGSRSSSTTPARWTAPAGARAAARTASYDAIWFSSNRYLALIDGAPGQARPPQIKIMSSPVLLGLRAANARRLGWDADAGRRGTRSPSRGGRGKFTYGMTNPASSNSGFSALVGVAAALSGAGAALTHPAVDRGRAAAEGVLRRPAADRGILRLAVGHATPRDRAGWTAWSTTSRCCSLPARADSPARKDSDNWRHHRAANGNGPPLHLPAADPASLPIFKSFAPCAVFGS